MIYTLVLAKAKTVTACRAAATFAISLELSGMTHICVRQALDCLIAVSAEPAAHGCC